ncbi:MAG: hypothetical protein DWQ08_05975 [Proteobacteria bacterium]|nr:MAG: hypothetical protein DWQ08_05975 [Pseudomonadota bacterium]
MTRLNIVRRRPPIYRLLPVTTIAAAFVVASVNAHATELDDYDNMSTTERVGALMDRARVVYAWLVTNEPRRAACFRDTFSKPDIAMRATARLVHRLRDVPSNDRRATILGVIVLGWMRDDLCDE